MASGAKLLRVPHATFDGDQVERRIPGDRRTDARALGALSQRRTQQAVVAVDALLKLADLGADVAAGDLVERRAVDLGDAAAAQRDGERARIGTVERACGLDVRFRHG